MKCASLKVLLGLSLLLAGMAAWGETAPATVTVALVTSQGKHASVLPVAALAEAELSKEVGIVLVERSQIAAILTEQELSGGGLTDAARAVALGRLLKADLFAVIETEGVSPAPTEATASQTNPVPVALVVYDVTTGCRYWDAPLPEKTEPAVSAIVSGVRQAVEKSLAAAGKLQTICLLPVRNAGLPREMDAYCELIGALLERRLTRAPGVAVLERKRLEHVLKERELPGAE